MPATVPSLAPSDPSTSTRPSRKEGSRPLRAATVMAPAGVALLFLRKQ
jgi:hypothetical protein